MKRPDEILNECVFDNTIKKDTATVTVEVAIEAMKRYSSEIASKQREACANEIAEEERAIN